MMPSDFEKAWIKKTLHDFRRDYEPDKSIEECLVILHLDAGKSDGVLAASGWPEEHRRRFAKSTTDEVRRILKEYAEELDEKNPK